GVFVFQVAIPGEGHEDVRGGQERDWKPTGLDQHIHKRTGIFFWARNRFTSPTVYSPKWKMLAASTASALPSSSTSAMCSSLPAPPLATTGTPTDSLMRRVMTRSNPAFVPSASMLFNTISPAPRDTARFAHSTASRPVSLRPPCEKTPHLSGATDFASMETTMHWLPNFSAPARIRSGFARAEELMLILSAPARSIAYMSSTERRPPPTVSGMKHWSAARSMTSTIVARPWALAVMSKKTISSAP